MLMGTRRATDVETEVGGRPLDKPDENRSSPRRRVLRAGKIVLDNGSVLDCAVRDTSETGAKIRIAEPIPLPQEFTLYWPETRMIRSCINRWQHGIDCGIEFSGEPRTTHRDYGK